MKNNELLDALRSGDTDDISPRSRAEAIAIAIRQKMEETVEGTDVSIDTVTAETLLEGVTAYNSDGKLIKGTHTCKDSSTVITDFSYFCKDGARIDVLEHISTSKGTSFSYMFAECSSLTSIPALNTSSGKFFTDMFYGCKSLTTIPPLDTSKGMNFYGMFHNCSSLTSIPQLDTSNGTSFTNMFYNCSSLTSIPGLDTSKGTYFNYMFRICSSLKDITFTGTINVTGIDLSWSKLLTKASIISLVNALSSTATGQSVTVSQTAVNNAFTTDEWEALKATKSNWTITLKDS